VKKSFLKFTVVVQIVVILLSLLKVLGLFTNKHYKGFRDNLKHLFH